MPKKPVTASAPVATISADDVQVGEPVVPTVDSSDVTVTPAAVQPDFTVHDPVTYSGLIGQNFLQMQHAQSLPVTVDDITKVEQDSLAKAQDYRKAVAQQAQEARTRVGERQALITSPGYVDKDGNPIPAGQPIPADAIRIPSIAEREETLKANVQTAAAEQQKQFEQGPGAVAQAAAIKQAGGVPGLVRALGTDDMAKLDAMTNGYEAVDNLGNYFNKMMEKPRLGVGGQLLSVGGHLQVLADATSPEALAFSRASDAAIVPIGRGVMGETGASPTKESMIELAKTITMPRIQDDDQTGNQGVFQLKQRIMQNLQSMRDNRYNAGFDTTPLDKAIAKYNSNFMSPDVQKYNPLATQANPLVGVGSSNQANAIINSVRAGATAGIQMPAQQQIQQLPAGQAGAYQMPPSPPAPPTVASPNYGRQSLQANQQIGHAVASLAGMVAQQPGQQAQALGNIWNAIQSVLPENQPSSIYQKPRPWETTPEYVGQ